MNDVDTSTRQITVRLERLLPGPIERVWAYLTDSEKRKTWFAGGTFELRVGGKAELYFDHSNITSEPRPADMQKRGESVCLGTITRLEPPRLISYTFGFAGPESEVTFELQPRGKQVLFILTHVRIADRKIQVNVSAGWELHLAILEDRLNGVEPGPFWSNYAKLVREYDAKL